MYRVVRGSEAQTRFEVAVREVGVILYMFLVGLELDPALLRKRGHATVAISHASILVPFLLGAALSLLLYPRLSVGASALGRNNPRRPSP